MCPDFGKDCFYAFGPPEQMRRRVCPYVRRTQIAFSFLGGQDGTDMKKARVPEGNPAPAFETAVYKIMTNVPSVIRTPPMTTLAVTASCRKINAMIMVMTTLNLSIGTTLDASPI